MNSEGLETTAAQVENTASLGAEHLPRAARAWRRLPSALRTRRAGAVTAGVLALAVVGGVAAAALPQAGGSTGSVPVSAATTSSDHSKGHLCRLDLLALKHDYDALPTAMRSDLKAAAHASSKTARHDAEQNVLKKARSGGYGTAVESAAKDKKTVAGLKTAWDRLPSALRDDLHKAKEASGDTRTSDLKSLVSKAESGGYGTRVKDATDKVKTRLDKCVAHVASGAKASTSSPVPSSPAPTPTPSASATAGA